MHEQSKLFASLSNINQPTNQPKKICESSCMVNKDNHNRKRSLQRAFDRSLAQGSQRRLVSGSANAGTGDFNFLTLTGGNGNASSPPINPPASYNFGNI